jgi:ATP-dependent Clp protease ATP-binding subunit ClpA
MLTDGKGRNVDFKNTIIIMTSNFGVENLSSTMGGEDKETRRDILMEKVRETQTYHS